MEKENTLTKANVEKSTTSTSGLHRRDFLTKLGGAAGVGIFLASCQKSVTSEMSSSSAVSKDGMVSFEGDYGILNYAFLLEQLEAAFYIMVNEHFYSPSNTSERMNLSDIRDHEIAHREFFKTALGTYGIPDLEFDFSSVDFSSRTSVLTQAKTFEDLGVGAYNGAGKYIKNPDYLVAAGKIVSVEGRHAAYLRNLLMPGSFADMTVVDSNGLDVAYGPLFVVKSALPFIKTPLDLTALPS